MTLDIISYAAAQKADLTARRLLKQERFGRRELLRDNQYPTTTTTPSVVFNASPNVAPFGGAVYFPPSAGTTRGAHFAAFTANAATTYTGESFIAPDNVAGGTAPSSWEFLTDAQFFHFTYTNGPAFRLFVDGQLVQQPVAATFTGDLNSATATTTVSNVSSVTGLVVGQTVTGAGILPNTKITAVGSTTITLDTGAVITGTAVALTAYTLPNTINTIFMDGGGSQFSPPATIYRTGSASGNQSRRIQVNFTGNTVRVGNNSDMGGNEAGRIRRIRLEWVNGAFGGVYLPAQAMFMPARASVGKLGFFGDSYSAGTGADNAMTGYTQGVSRLLGREVWTSSLGGTGYINAGSYVKLRDRLATDLYPFFSAANGDEIVLSMGANDTPTGVQAEVAAVLAGIATNCPGVPVHVLGAITPSSPPTNSNWAQTTTAIQAAAAAAPNVVSFTDPAGWFKGTGYLTNRQVNGAADHLISSDGVHPVQRGHDVLARRFAESFVSAAA